MVGAAARVACALFVLGLTACSDSVTMDGGLDAGIDAGRGDAGFGIVSVAPPVGPCGSVSILVDVRNVDHVSGLTESDFSYQLHDGITGERIDATNTCFAEVSGDAGPSGYSFCFDGLPTTLSIVLELHVTTPAGPVEGSVGFSNYCSRDGGRD